MRSLLEELARRVVIPEAVPRSTPFPSSQATFTSTSAFSELLLVTYTRALGEHDWRSVVRLETILARYSACDSTSLASELPLSWALVEPDSEGCTTVTHPDRPILRAASRLAMAIFVEMLIVPLTLYISNTFLETPLGKRKPTRGGVGFRG